TSLPGTGSLTFNGNPVTANQVIAVAQLGLLVFTPTASTHGTPYTTFGFAVSDGTLFSSPATFTLNVLDSSAPTTSDNSATLNENTTRSFATADFAFADTDPADTLQAVEILSLPSAGTLTLNGNP